MSTRYIDKYCILYEPVGRGTSCAMPEHILMSTQVKH